MKAYRHVDDRDEPIIRQTIPERRSYARQVRPLTAETIEAIASYAERHECGSLNGTASDEDVERMTRVRSL